jgi:hypothetical protein
MKLVTGARRWIPPVLAIALAGLATDGLDAATAAGNQVALAPHRAVYDLKLSKSQGSRGIEAVRGRILYDFSGNACEGYQLQFRQVSELDSGEGQPALSDLRSNTWEDGNARKFRFSSENLFNERRTDIVDGHAERNAKAVAVSLSKPKEMSFNVTEGAVFPTEHMRRIIAAAREGKSVLEFPVYDGSESGEKLFNTLTVIGRPISAGENRQTMRLPKRRPWRTSRAGPSRSAILTRKTTRRSRGASRRRSIRSASSSTRMAFRVPWSSTTPISRSLAR